MQAPLFGNEYFFYQNLIKFIPAPPGVYFTISQVVTETRGEDHRPINVSPTDNGLTHCSLMTSYGVVE